MDHHVLRLVASAILAAVSMPVMADNPDVQEYFFQACQSASNALAARCAATPSGLGNLSGDSESSLNPSQNLSHTKSSASLADVRSTEARGRAAVMREGDAPAVVESETVQLGPFNVLVQGRASWFERDRDPAVDRERGLDGDGWAVEVGLDRRVSERLFIGALATFESIGYEFVAELPGVNFVPASQAGSADTDSRALTLFAVLNTTKSTYVDAAVGYGRQEHDFRRNPVFQGSERDSQYAGRVAGDTESRVFWMYASGGIDFVAGPATFGPYAGFTYADSEIDGYTERDLNDSGLSMSFAPCSRESMLGHIGLRADRAYSTSHGVFVPQLRVEYLREFETDALTQTSHYVLDSGTSSLSVTGDELEADRFNIGVGVSAVFRNGWMAFLNFDTLAGGEMDRQRISLGLRVEL